MKGFYSQRKKKFVYLGIIIALILFDIFANIATNRYYESKKKNLLNSTKKIVEMGTEESTESTTESETEESTEDSTKETTEDIGVSLDDIKNLNLDNVAKKLILGSNTQNNLSSNENKEGKSIDTDVSGKSQIGASVSNNKVEEDETQTLREKQKTD